jgi:hypothetical protein
MEIQFTRIVRTYFSTELETDAVTALLDEYRVGETGESVSDRLSDAHCYSATNEAFWAALAALVGTETVDTETDFDLDEEDSADDESDDDDEEQDDEDEDDESDNEDTSDLSGILIDA